MTYPLLAIKKSHKYQETKEADQQTQGANVSLHFWSLKVLR